MSCPLWCWVDISNPPFSFRQEGEGRKECPQWHLAEDEGPGSPGSGLPVPRPQTQFLLSSQSPLPTDLERLEAPEGSWGSGDVQKVLPQGLKGIFEDKELQTEQSVSITFSHHLPSLELVCFLLLASPRAVVGFSWHLEEGSGQV